MSAQKKIVISASRRTDIPAFYMDWFMKRIKIGEFIVINPYNKKIKRVKATPDHVHTIVFWSKNFNKFLDCRYGEKLEKAGYHLFFNFTINSDSPILEPGIPDLTGRLFQLQKLCKRFHPDSVTWRFDPICFYTFNGKDIKNNLSNFSQIADMASKCGVTRCITSFVDYYPKIKKRTGSIKNFSFIDPSVEYKKNVLLKLEKKLIEKNIHLYTCCENAILNILPLKSNIKQSSCIPNNLLMELFGGYLSLRKDTGQRIKDGCGCMVSVDIGSYKDHPCFHNCLFCYANPAKPGFNARH